MNPLRTFVVALATLAIAPAAAMADPTLLSEDFRAEELTFPHLLMPVEGEGVLLGEGALVNAVRLGPNGKDTARWSVTVTDQNGKPVPNAEVEFSVQAVYPLGWWRDLNEVKARYKGNAGWKGKRLLGSVSPTRVRTDSSGRALTTYTASHIGGDNPQRPGEERLTARLSNGATVNATVKIGYTHLRPIKAVPGGLELTSRAKGAYAHKDLAAMLTSLGEEVKKAGWPQPVRLTEASYPWGGMIPPHSGHLHGLTIDLRPMSHDGNPTHAGNSTCPKASTHAGNYDRARTKMLADAFQSSAPVRLFNDAEIPSVSCASGHHNHLHVSWLERSVFDEDNLTEDVADARVSAGVREMFSALTASRAGASDPFESERVSLHGGGSVFNLPSLSPGSLGLGVKVYTRNADAVVLSQEELDPAAVSFFSTGGLESYLDWKGGPEFSPRRLLDSEILFVGEAPVPEFADEPFAMLNEDAADTHQVREAANKHSLSGAGVLAGVWDGGGVRTTHDEFDPRATQADGATTLSNHATHVAGTIGAQGSPRAEARGMAPAVSLLCYDWNSNTDEMLAAPENLVCSNHSYGMRRGWAWDPRHGWLWWGTPKVDENEDYMFGKYSGESYLFDSIVHQRQTFSVLVAAGNDRNDAPASQPVQHWVREGGEWVQTSRVRLPDNWDDGGYDTVEGAGVAKNVITVGAIHDMLAEPPTPEDIRITSFSNWGPTDDGRIKPDVVANGWQLLSTSSSRDDAYEEMSGTSMATPAATGICSLLSELFTRQRDRMPYAEELKAALIHTAMSIGEGPTYQIGWGSIRADHAADLIEGSGGRLDTLGLNDGAIELQGVGAQRERAIRVTIVWTDPPASPNSGGLDDPMPVLVNDLDLTLIDPNGVIYQPWVLDPDKPSRAATRGRNSVDNVERIDVAAEDAVPGTWTIRVTGPRQRFAIAVSGLEIE